MTITISGKVKTGKSVIAQAISRALKAHGLNVLINDCDHPDGLNDKYIHGCLDSLRDKEIPIEIKLIRES